MRLSGAHAIDTATVLRRSHLHLSPCVGLLATSSRSLLENVHSLGAAAPSGWQPASALARELYAAARPGADAPPNHISFLSEGTNDEMVKFLSPFLPLARLLGIPLLDFDAYQLSGDAAPTARAVTPAVLSFFRSNA